MKSFTCVLILSLVISTVSAQNYYINFAGTGAANIVDSVKVENLSQCTALSISGADTLLLCNEVGIPEVSKGKVFTLHVSPNPSDGDFLVLVETTVNCDVAFALYDLSGKVILVRMEKLAAGINSFSLRGIRNGLYVLKAGSDKSMQTVKIISTAAGSATPALAIGSVSATNTNMPVSGNHIGKVHLDGQSVIVMQFNPGDTLKLTGKSGIFRTVSMLFPVSSQTVIFTFVDCTDIDNNHYAVVQIGSQLWMGENLKTTKYRDGSAIPNVTDSAAWAALTTGAYCNFLNDTMEGEMYGRLYNFYAVDDSRNVCPAGWHVPSSSEWNILEKFLDSTVDTTALGPTGLEIGRILKEGCDTRWQYWDTTYGFNSSGFTALCANFRGASGGWALAPDHNHDTSFWTSTSYSNNSAWFRSLRWCYSDIYSLFPMKTGGNSVRCIRDN